ncbi:hypothetical protein V1523DRAFT_422288, partial [Lipomyces doorenjongii]
MSADVFSFACGHCDHVPFESPDKLNKHISSRHRQASSFNYNGVSHPLIAADGKYLCPKCGAAMAGVYNMRRHLARVCGRSAHAFSTDPADVSSRIQSETEDAAAQQDAAMDSVPINICSPIDD